MSLLLRCAAALSYVATQVTGGPLHLQDSGKLSLRVMGNLAAAVQDDEDGLTALTIVMMTRKPFFVLVS
eukprot:5334574-Pyramimonas_sp.AAC.1